MRISDELVVSRGPESVFRWIEDPALASKWQPEVAQYEITRPCEGMVGTEFREVLKDGRGSMELRGRVVGYVRNERMAFDLAGKGMRLSASYQLTPEGSGTRLRADLEARIGGWLSFLVEPLLRRRMASQLRTELLRLRELCQAEGLSVDAPPPSRR